MKYVCEFKFRKEAIKKATELAAGTSNEKLKQILIKFMQGTNFDEASRGAFILLCTLAGLLRIGFSQNEAQNLLENLFIIEIKDTELSPGSKSIN